MRGSALPGQEGCDASAGLGGDHAEAVLDFWFPEDGHDRDFEAHRLLDLAHARRRGRGDLRALQRLAEAAAKGLLDHWSDTPRGRLALVVALDQFSRSVWRGTPGAFGQDIKAARLVLEALKNGHYDALPTAWEKTFCLIALGHCEGPDHLARIERGLWLAGLVVGEAPEHLRTVYRVAEDQNRLARDVIARFGRYPHRNPVLGRISTPEEEAYIAAGQFPHAARAAGEPGGAGAHARRRGQTGAGRVMRGPAASAFRGPLPCRARGLEPAPPGRT